MKKDKTAPTKTGSAPARPKAPKAPKAPPPTAEAVAAHLLVLCSADEPPAPWKEADLKRRLPAGERPLLPAALARLQSDREVLALTQGKTTSYLFAEPLRRWLGSTTGAAPEAPAALPPVAAASDLFAVYARLVRQSGGFPDVKIATLRAALDPASAEALPARLVALWREGRATLSLGDWSLADENTRASAVELSGERYLLVRLDHAAD